MRIIKRLDPLWFLDCVLDDEIQNHSVLRKAGAKIGIGHMGHDDEVKGVNG